MYGMRTRCECYYSKLTVPFVLSLDFIVIVAVHVVQSGEVVWYVVEPELDAATYL